MNTLPQSPPIQALEYFEQRNDDLRPIVRLLLLAGAVFFLSSAVSGALSVVQIWPQTRRGASTSSPFQSYGYLASMLGQSGAGLALALGCALCWFGSRARIYTCCCAVIVMAFRLVFALFMMIQYAAMSKSPSFRSYSTPPVMILQQMIGVITGCVLPLLLIAVLNRPQVRGLLERNG